MYIKHSVKRAAERYNIIDFEDQQVLKKIKNNNCLLIKEDTEKQSKCFLVLYINKYLKVITDYDINFVKTVLPFVEKDFVYIDLLLSKSEVISKKIA